MHCIVTTDCVTLWWDTRVYIVTKYSVSQSPVLPSVLWRWLLGSKKGSQPLKNWVVGCWCCYLSGTRCIFAYAQLMPLYNHIQLTNHGHWTMLIILIKKTFISLVFMTWLACYLNQATGYATKYTWCLYQAWKNWRVVARMASGIIMVGMMEVGWSPARLLVHLLLLYSLVP